MTQWDTRLDIGSSSAMFYKIDTYVTHLLGSMLKGHGHDLGQKLFLRFKCFDASVRNF